MVFRLSQSSIEDERLLDNEQTWNIVASEFFNASALPEWGPFGVGQNIDFFSGITGKEFLEIGCGSGRSIRYLIENGSAKVTGLDISKVQLEEATRFNAEYLGTGKFELFHVPMEQRIQINPVDVVFSIYALGWTIDPMTVLGNIYSYLKEGGLFIWSWDHAFFSNVQYENGKYVIAHSYHDETPLALKDWKKSGTTAHLIYRKTSTWFQMLVDSGFEITAYLEPTPVNMNRGESDPARYYSIDKAKKVPATFIFVCRKK